MYEKLTSLLEYIKTDLIGEWIVDKENDGSPEHPIHFPFVTYSECVNRFEHEVYAFEEANPGYGLNRYVEILVSMMSLSSNLRSDIRYLPRRILQKSMRKSYVRMLVRQFHGADFTMLFMIGSRNMPRHACNP